MSLPPLPPKYLPIPIESIRDAYRPDKRHGELFLTLCSLLALAWENNFQHTPRLREEDLYNVTQPDGSEKPGYLALSRRQYFQHKREMMLLGWLRSSSPAIGYVQFTFTRAISQADSTAVPEPSAENCTGSAKNRTDALKRIEEEDSSLTLNTESSSSSSLKQNPVRKTALEPANDIERKMFTLVEHLHLAFDPQDYGALEWRDLFLAGIPERALGWIAKAYQDRTRLESPIGLIVKHILDQDAPKQYYLDCYRDILPEEYLEAIDELQIECEFCAEIFLTRGAKDEHRKTVHAHHCDECGSDFEDADQLKTHYEAEHDPYRIRKIKSPDIPASVLDGTIETTWTAVLAELQQEMPRASFDTWVRDAQVICYDGNTLTIGARNAYAKDWLANRLSAKIAKIAGTLLEKPVQVCVEVAE